MMIKNVVRNVVPAVTVMFAGLLGAYMVYQGFYSDNITAVTISQYEPAAGDEMVGEMVDDMSADHMMSVEMDHSATEEDHIMEGGMDWELSADESTMTDDSMDTEMVAEETMTTEEVSEETVAAEGTEAMDTEIMTDEAVTDMAAEDDTEMEMEAETEMQAGMEEETMAPSDMMMEENGKMAPATIEPAAE